jgi:hypothetical protein
MTISSIKNKAYLAVLSARGYGAHCLLIGHVVIKWVFVKHAERY